MTQVEPTPLTASGESTALGGTRHLPLSIASVAMVLTCSLIWGGQAIAAKLSVDTIPAIVVLGLRLALALPVLWLAAYGGRWRFRLVARQWWPIIGNTILVLLQIGLFLVGTGLTNSARSIVIVNTFPLFAALASPLLTNDAGLRRREGMGLLLAFLGLQLVLVPRMMHGTQVSLLGDALVLLSAILIGIKIAFMRRILADLNPLQTVFWSSLLGAALCGVLSLLTIDIRAIDFSVAAVVAILYQGFLVSGVAVLLWTYLLSQHAVNKLTVFRLATPPLGIFMSWLFLSEALTLGLVFGTVLIAVGIQQVHRRAERTTP